MNFIAISLGQLAYGQLDIAAELPGEFHDLHLLRLLSGIGVG